MKNYIKKNLEPLLIGFLAAIVFIFVFNTVNDIIVKIALINSK